MTLTSNGSILYRARRLRFIITAVFLFPMTVGIAVLAYDGILLGDPDVRGAWLFLPLGALYIWFDYMLVVKLVWPPELEISMKGVRWSNRAMLQRNTNYSWQEIDGPVQSVGGRGVPLLQLTVKATDRKLELPPSHFGATYDEMAGVISAARAGKLISPEQWRSGHPQHPLKHWLLEWGLPIAGGIVLAIWLGGFRR